MGTEESRDPRQLLLSENRKSSKRFKTPPMRKATPNNTLYEPHYLPRNFPPCLGLLLEFLHSIEIPSAGANILAATAMSYTACATLEDRTYAAHGTASRKHLPKRTALCTQLNPSLADRLSRTVTIHSLPCPCSHCLQDCSNFLHVCAHALEVNCDIHRHFFYRLCRYNVT